MRQDGWTLYEQHTDFLRYDIREDKLYVFNGPLVKGEK